MSQAALRLNRYHPPVETKFIGEMTRGLGLNWHAAAHGKSLRMSGEKLLSWNLKIEMIRVDLTTPQAVEVTFNVLSVMVDKLEQLMGYETRPSA